MIYHLHLTQGISIHALREEGDCHTSSCVTSTSQFLSTPSARRATMCCKAIAMRKSYFYPRPPRGGRQADFHRVRFQRYFYPRPPRGGRRRRTDSNTALQPISIHALREEGDRPANLWATGSRMTFLPTPSARRATTSLPISTIIPLNFYPRPPRGGRRISFSFWKRPKTFLSTPSARRATSVRHPHTT